MAHICTPTLIIRALDDPFFMPTDIPFESLAANKAITASLPKHGGHVGFVENYAGRSWAVRQAARFLSNRLRTVLATRQP